MATANFIAAAKKANRQPTVLMAIESSDAIQKKYTTQSDWQGSITLTNIDTTTIPGDAALLRPQVAADTGFQFILQGAVRFTSFPATSYLYSIRARVYWAKVAGTSVTTDIKVYAGGTVTPVLGTTNSVLVTQNGSHDASTYYGDATFAFTASLLLTSGNSYDLVSSAQFSPSFIATNLSATTTVLFDTFDTDVNYTLPSGTSGTSTIDLGLIPSADSILTIDDTLESGSTLTYTALGGNADPPVNNLGAVSDGSTLTAYRYYRITANFTATSGGRGSLHEIAISGGNNIFRYYGTHQDIPFGGVRPHIISGSLSPLSQKIDLKKGISTTGQISVKLAWVRDPADLVATNYLKGKDVQVSAGFVGLSSVDYEPVITGVIFDFSLDEKNGEITLQIQDIFKQFEKRKIPTETYDANGVKTSSDIPYSNSNLVDTITDVYDKVGIRGRYIDTAAYSALASGDLSGNDYRCTRTLSKPIKATELLDELAQTGGLFLVPTGDGKIRPKLYDATETPTVTIDIAEQNISNIKGNQKELITRSYHYFNATVSDPKESDDYDRAYASIDAESEILYDPEIGEKQFFDKWEIGSNAGAALTSPPQALIDQADRWNGWWSEPRHSLTIKDMGPRYADIDPGDIVGLTNLELPIPQDEWDGGTTYSVGDKRVFSGRVYRSLQGSNLNKTPSSEPTWWHDEDLTATLAPGEFGRGLTDNKPFIVLSRKFDANKALITLDVWELP